jgi:hypothetical protein
MSLQNAIASANASIHAIQNLSVSGTQLSKAWQQRRSEYFAKQGELTGYTLTYPIIVFENGYVFSWTSRKYLETGDRSDVLIGSSGFIYDETTSFLYVMGSRLSSLSYMQEFVKERESGNFTIFKPQKLDTDIPPSHDFHGEIWHNDLILAEAKQAVKSCFLVMESEEKTQLSLLSCFFIFEYGYAFYYAENKNAENTPITSDRVLIYNKNTKLVYSPRAKYIFKASERYNFLTYLKQLIDRKIFNKKSDQYDVENAEYLNIMKNGKSSPHDAYFYIQKFSHEVEKGRIWSFLLV